MNDYIAVAGWAAGLIAFAIAAAPALRTRITDRLGRYTRLTCPRCPLVIRYRGVDAAEAQQLRQRMADHTATHAAP